MEGEPDSSPSTVLFIWLCSIGFAKLVGSGTKSGLTLTFAAVANVQSMRFTKSGKMMVQTLSQLIKIQMFYRWFYIPPKNVEVAFSVDEFGRLYRGIRATAPLS